MKLRTLAPLVRKADARTTPLPPKKKNPVYNTPEFRAWRKAVADRAGNRCEGRDKHGLRCTSEHWLSAHHIHELRDGGALLDLNNGELLCRSCHEKKTIAARVRRLHR
jgi:5-methylcytosine-specific restriction endonuclease McrA